MRQIFVAGRVARTFRTCAVLAAAILASAVFGGTTHAGKKIAGRVRVEVLALREVRTAIYARDTKAYAPVVQPHTGVTVYLRVYSPAIRQPTSYGHIKIITDVDNTGQVLGNRRRAARFPVPMRSAMARSMRLYGRLGFPVILRLGVADRKATKITRLRGSFLVYAGGKKRTVTVGHLAANAGKPVRDKTLAAAHMHMLVVKPRVAAKGGIKWLTVKISGPTGAFQNAQVTNAAGRDISKGQIEMGNRATQREIAFPLRRPLKSTDRLTVHIIAGQRVFKVPFDLRNIQLP